MGCSFYWGGQNWTHQEGTIWARPGSKGVSLKSLSGRRKRECKWPTTDSAGWVRGRSTKPVWLGKDKWWVVDNEIRYVIKGNAFGFYYKWRRECLERFWIVECLELIHLLKAYTLLPCEKQIIENNTLIISWHSPLPWINIVFVESCVLSLHSPSFNVLSFEFPLLYDKIFTTAFTEIFFYRPAWRILFSIKKLKGKTDIFQAISSSPFIEILYCISRIQNNLLISLNRSLGV